MYSHSIIRDLPLSHAFLSCTEEVSFFLAFPSNISSTIIINHHTIYYILYLKYQSYLSHFQEIYSRPIIITFSLIITHMYMCIGSLIIGHTYKYIIICEINLDHYSHYLVHACFKKLLMLEIDTCGN